MKVLATILRLMLGALFLYAGSVKLLSPDEFGATIVRLVPVTLSEGIVFGSLVASAECVAGSMLLIGYRIRIASGILCAMIVGFTAIYLPPLVDPASDAVCGCFGEPSRVDAVFFLRNTALFVAALFIRRYYDHPRSADDRLRQR